jgi:hypothetical protein
MRFYKISQTNPRFAHLDVGIKFNDAKSTSEVREEIEEIKCKLLAELGPLLVGQDITVSTPKEHEEPVVVDMTQPVSDVFRGTPATTDTPEPEDTERQRQQEEIMRRQRMTMGV